MSYSIKLAIAGLAATLAMAVAVGSVSARNFRLSSQTSRVTWGPLRFFGEGGVEAEMRCPLTLEGTFHATTIAKVARTLIGFITRARSGTSTTGCTRGSVTILQETLPWHLTYERFSGTLPRITRIRLLLRGISFRVDPGIGIACRYGHPEENAAGEINLGASGEANSISADNTIRLRGFGEFGCPPEGGFEGTSNSLTVLSATTRITVTLI